MAADPPSSVPAGADASNDPQAATTGELVTRLSTQISDLVHTELQLAKAELAQKGKRAGLGAGFIGGGALFGLGAFGAFTAMLIALLGLAMDTWIAALIVTVVYGAIAAVLALRGKNKIQEATPPAEQTVETLKEDARWAKTLK